MQFIYSEWSDRREGDGEATFDQLLDLFLQLLEYTAGDAAEALRWLTAIDEQHQLTGEGAGIGGFVDELRRRGFLREDDRETVRITARTERSIRQRSLEAVFERLRKGQRGRHRTPFAGAGDERLPETRPWQYGDEVSDLDVTGTLWNAFQRSGDGDLNLAEGDFQVFETDHLTNVATVLMIDLSHSMVLYGEDRITPARRTALALAELIMTRFPGDTLDIVAFGDEAWEVSVGELPYLQVGPYYTNTLAGLQRARDLLRKRKNRNRQIFMITDGKPSCHIEFGRMYRNAFGLDRKIVNRVLDESVRCRRERIAITTFMVARDPYLQQFVRRLAEANRGRAYYSSLEDLGAFIFEDYVRNRRGTVR